MLTSLHTKRLRRRLRTARTQLSKADVRNHSDHVCNLIVACELFCQARRVALYRAVHKELSVDALYRHALRSGKEAFLPRVESPGEMRFIRCEPSTVLVRSSFGIEEPAGGDKAAASTLDLVIVPMVGFDASGERLGAGGGYYDRAFAFRQQRATPVLIGVAHSLQGVDQLQPAPWDIPMDAIVTELGWAKELP